MEKGKNSASIPGVQREAPKSDHEDVPENEFAAIISGNRAVADTFFDALDGMIDSGRDYGTVALRVRKRLAKYHRLLRLLEAGLDDEACRERHGMDWNIWVSRSPESREITVRGPGNSEEVIKATTDEEAEQIADDLDWMSAECQTFEALENEVVTAVKLEAKAGYFHAEKLSTERAQRAERIRLLAEYNEAKDAVQEMLGRIAENTDTPISSQYDGRFGVTKND